MRYFRTSRLYGENVLKEKDLMEVIMWIAVVFVSQSDVNINLGEAGLDLILVCLPIFGPYELNE
jgi:hypothetical protein